MRRICVYVCIYDVYVCCMIREYMYMCALAYKSEGMCVGVKKNVCKYTSHKCIYVYTWAGI